MSPFRRTNNHHQGNRGNTRYNGTQGSQIQTATAAQALGSNTEDPFGLTLAAHPSTSTTLQSQQGPQLWEQTSNLPPFTMTGDGFHFNDNLPTDEPTRFLMDLDVNRQLQAAPSRNTPGVNRYPHQFHNRDLPPMNLVAAPPIMEYPVRPTGETYTGIGDNLGPTRGFYNSNDRNDYNVGYHDPTRPPLNHGHGRGRGRGRGGGLRPSYPFTAATFIPPDHELDENVAQPAATQMMFDFDHHQGVRWFSSTTTTYDDQPSKCSG